MIIRGEVIRFGDHVDTDVIIPARYLVTTDPSELSIHCFEPVRPNFYKEASKKIIVAGKNFGCGSSREHAPLSIKACGVLCVVAESFARIFYRNAINTGLLVVETGQNLEQIEEGDMLSLDLEKGTIFNETKGSRYEVPKFPPFMQELIDAGGLMKYVRKRLENA